MKSNLALAAIAATLMMSCSSNNDVQDISNNPSSELKITASINGTVSRAEKNAWTAGDELGVYVCNENLGTPYRSLPEYSNIKFVYSTSGWTSNKVVLDATEGTVYAYYPYSSSVDPQSISVNVSEQTDLLYGKGDSKVSLSAQNANITMKHALSQVVFKVKKDAEYVGNGIISGVELKNEGSSTLLKTAGTLNISSGEITATAVGSVNFAADVTLSETVVTMSSIVIPVAATPSKDIKVIFTIDGSKYQYLFPAATVWAAGTRNIYSLSLGKNGLEIGGADGSGVVITPWTDDNMGDIKLEPIA